MVAATPSPEDEAKIQTLKKITTGKEAAFPKEVLPQIWQKTFETSVMAQLAGTVPITLKGAVVPIPVGRATASIVGEGEVKPIVDTSTKIKEITTHKAAAMIVYSKEAAMANPLGEYNRIQNELKSAIARCIDVAVIHGKNAMSGTAINGQESLASAAHSKELDFASTKAGWLTAGLAEAHSMVTDQDEEDYDVSHFLFSKKMRGPLMTAQDGFGRPLYQASANLNDKFSSVMGIPTTYTKAVNGYEKVREPLLMGFAGDFKDNIRFGYVEGITFRKATEYTHGIDLFAKNMEAILVEAIFGFVIRDPKAFVKLTKKNG